MTNIFFSYYCCLQSIPTTVLVTLLLIPRPLNHVWLNLIYVEQMASKDTKRQVSKYIVNYYYYFYLLPAQSHAV